MAIACVIPARLNSSRFPGKLLEKAGDKTVLQHTFEKASKCSLIDNLFVATDNTFIAEHVETLGGVVIWTSPDCQNGTERIAQALQADKRLQQSSYIINLQGDHPCTEPQTLSLIVQALQKDETASMSTAVTLLDCDEDFLSPHIVKCVFDLSNNALYFSRSPIPYKAPQKQHKAYGHIGVYCYRTEFLKKMLTQPNSPLQQCEDLEQLKALEHGFRIKIAITSEKILGIDTPNDLKKLQEILCQSNTSL